MRAAHILKHKESPPKTMMKDMYKKMDRKMKRRAKLMKSGMK